MKKSFLILGGVLLLASCRKEQPVARAVQGPETISVSHWTNKTELFLEYQPLVTTAKRRFAIHLTDLATFQPVANGTVTVALKREGVPAETFTVKAPSRPGIFGVDVQPQNPDKYSMSISLDAPNLRDTYELGAVTVYSLESDIPASKEEQREEQIAFLKEQQWTLDFATQIATTRPMRESLVVTGEVRPRSGGEVDVVSPISGRVAESARLPVVGEATSQGQPLASIVPLAPGDRPVLELAIAEAGTTLDLARRDLARAERLLAVGAIPAKRVDEARAAQATAAARLTAAEHRLAQYEASRRADGSAGGELSFAVRAPISGVIAEVATTPGANVNQGARLFRVIAVDQVHVAANVPEAELPRLARLTGAEIHLPGLAQPTRASRLVSRSSLVDPRSRTLAVLFEVPNRERTLAIGQSVSVGLFLTGVVEAVAVPESAIVDDGGRPVVFVQKEGETFVRRPVKLGMRESNLVQITEGLQAGERVVTKSAYLIRLAALSSQIPAHGHVH